MEDIKIDLKNPGGDMVYTNSTSIVRMIVLLRRNFNLSTMKSLLCIAAPAIKAAKNDPRRKDTTR